MIAATLNLRLRVRLKGCETMLEYTIFPLDGGRRYSVVGLGPVYYTDSAARAEVVCSALNASQTVRDRVREIIDAEPRAAVSGREVLLTCCAYFRRA